MPSSWGHDGSCIAKALEGIQLRVRLGVISEGSQVTLAVASKGLCRTLPWGYGWRKQGVVSLSVCDSGIRWHKGEQFLLCSLWASDIRNHYSYCVDWQSLTCPGSFYSCSSGPILGVSSHLGSCPAISFLAWGLDRRKVCFFTWREMCVQEASFWTHCTTMFHVW